MFAFPGEKETSLKREGHVLKGRYTKRRKIFRICSAADYAGQLRNYCFKILITDLPLKKIIQIGTFKSHWFKIESSCMPI